MTKLEAARFEVLALSAALWMSLCGCAPAYRHYVANPTALDSLRVGSKVGLVLKNHAYVQGVIEKCEGERLRIRPDTAIPRYLTYDRESIAGPLTTSRDSIEVALDEVIWSSTLAPYDPSKVWAPHKKLEGGFIGFLIGAGLIGGLWLIL